ncbi:type IV pili methyl-accepting chemotaxis transducer N-terminal domain-containing protein [Sulfurospirillum multivorans]|uniref:PilJ domain-containing protein n=2 Tax=Sulfurospirillum multivorans TaxID=66821 RepID=A0AA86AMH3_SULMK|nr:type IV pili methyl-accepting chemotaxis transducer N-terminal domain-containing protein [Sulfurospirillum multivorans]AHJ12161.1 PilJ domain-containing protein [Sulfurospirillum multivorans DSM 12446]QEH05662.1 PilJ domain-containing protein [Sulfurospirillum multivorans]
MIKPTTISTKMKLAGGLLSFVIIFIISLTVMMNQMSKKDSYIINIAGKQRMLSQKISKETFFIVHRHTNDFCELNTAVGLFESSLKDLLYGNDAKGIYAPQNERIQTKLEEVMTLWLPFRVEVEALKSGIEEVRPDMEVLTPRIEKLLVLSDTVVQRMVGANLSNIHIDLSGRQRMLSQRMGLYVNRYLRSANAQDLLVYADAKALYNKTIKSFLDDAAVKNAPEVYAIVKENNAYWEEYMLYLDHVIALESEINKHLAFVYEKNVQLLNAMDEAVWLYTDHSEAKNDMFLKFQYIALIIGLIIIVYAFVMTKEIIEHLEGFVQKAKELARGDISSFSGQNVTLSSHSEDELKEASTHISLFVQKVNLAMKDSEDALKKAENAVSQLQQLAEEVEDVIEDMGIDENAKKTFDKNVNATEDIAIQSAENLIHVNRMLQKLKKSLNAMVESSNQTDEKKEV